MEELEYLKEITEQDKDLLFDNLLELYSLVGNLECEKINTPENKNLLKIQIYEN